jgi:hypothetical protein
MFSVMGCDWVSLATNALSYPTIQRGETANLAALGTLVYATRAEDGLAIIESGSGKVLGTLAPPPGSESIDDLAIDGTLLFVLDARETGYLSAYALDDPLHPHLVSPPRSVPVGPFSGVSARRGLCVVSGGTGTLTAWQYDRAGIASGAVATADLGRGQPDVLVSPNDDLVFVSTHYWGAYFGLDILRYDSVAHTLTTLVELHLDGAGFTSGGAKPANFPIQAAVLGRDSLLVAHARGLAVISTSRATGPRVLEVIDVGGPAVSVDIDGASAAVAVVAQHAAQQSALVILDFSPARPRTVRRIPLPAGTFPGGTEFSASRIAVAARYRGVLLFDR